MANQTQLSFFPKDSYLGVLRLFLRVLEVARSRRLGSVGEVSVWPDPATRETDFGGQKFARIFSQEFCSSQEFSSQEFGRVQLLIGKTIIGRFSNRKLRAREFVRARRGPGFLYTEIADS